MVNGIVNNEEEDWGTIAGRIAKTAGGTAEYIGASLNQPMYKAKESAESFLGIQPVEPGVTSEMFRKRREELLPGGATLQPVIGGGLQAAGYRKIIHDQAQGVSDKVVQDWIGRTDRELGMRTPVTPPVSSPTQPTPAPVSVVNAPVQPGESYTDRMSKSYEDWAAGGGVILRQPGGTVFQNINQGRPEMEALELEKQIGVTPRSGMAEYEESARRMREDARLSGIVSGLPAREGAGVISEALKSKSDIERTRIGAVSEQQKANVGYQAKIYEAGAKSQADWAKLGIQAQDTQSKMQYRKAQIDDLMTKTGLIEPMKIRLAQAKTGMESRKIQRDFAMQALDKIFAPRLKEYQESVMSGMPRTPEQQAKFNQLMQDHDNAIANIDNMYPEEGKIKQFEDGKTGRFTNGQWVDITDQIKSRGIVGRG